MMNIKIKYRWISQNWQTLSELDNFGIEKVYSDDKKKFITPKQSDFEKENKAIDNKFGANYRDFLKINPYIGINWKINKNLLITEKFSLPINNIEGVTLKTPWWSHIFNFIGVIIILFLLFHFFTIFSGEGESIKKEIYKIGNMVGYLALLWFFANALTITITCKNKNYKIIGFLPKTIKDLQKLRKLLSEKISDNITYRE